MNSGEVCSGPRTIPLCPNCREVNCVYAHEGDIFECGHCDQLYTFNPIGRRIPDEALDDHPEPPLPSEPGARSPEPVAAESARLR